jgi:RNA polymerase sigma-70 factor (ECF subfamily)
LLERLQHDPRSAEWNRLVALYEPLIRGWLQRHALMATDSDDLVQEVLAVVIRRLPEFRHNQRVGAFRTWLRTITANCLREFWRGKKYRPSATGDSDFQMLLQQLEDPASDLSLAWDREHDQHVVRRMLEMLRPSFEERTWLAFQRVSLEGVSAGEVAAELGITTNAVFIAKSRVLARLRQEASGLIDE